ncbi:MAG: DUF4369 domain-containing protein [Bacteroidia bacterium]|nr:DUF4369 domain-containing protein [Bacteroidia bacterium]
MKRLLFILLIIAMVSCENKESNLIVTGKITGLKKGVLYLEQLQDTSLVVLDSMIINGEPEFVLQARLEGPEMLYVSLDSNSDEKPRLSFFADEGTTTIHTSLKRFVHDSRIEGSQQQKLIDEYKSMISQYNDRNLELIKAEFENQGDSIKLDSIRNAADNLLKSKYRYTFNFAMTNNESEVAPYLVLSEVYDANITYLDTLINVLPDNILQSKYGKELQEYIVSRKKDSLN